MSHKDDTSAPETSAPETSAPETSAPETSAPETSAPETSAPGAVTPTDTVPCVPGFSGVKVVTSEDYARALDAEKEYITALRLTRMPGFRACLIAKVNLLFRRYRSWSAVARATNIPAALLSRYRAGRSWPNMPTMRRIDQEYDATVEFFIARARATSDARARHAQKRRSHAVPEPPLPDPRPECFPLPQITGRPAKVEPALPPNSWLDKLSSTSSDWK